MTMTTRTSTRTKRAGMRITKGTLTVHFFCREKMSVPIIVNGMKFFLRLDYKIVLGLNVQLEHHFGEDDQGSVSVTKLDGSTVQL